MLELMEIHRPSRRRREGRCVSVHTNLRAEGAKGGVFQFTPTFVPKARRPPAYTRPSSLSCVLDILCICTIYVSKYFCVLYSCFIFLWYSYIAMLHLHLWWFYYIQSASDFRAPFRGNNTELASLPPPASPIVYLTIVASFQVSG